MKTRKLWEKFPNLVAMVRKDHEERGLVDRSHDFLHALTAAQYGEIIAPDHYIGLLAWVAGICHNTDRLFGNDEVEKRLYQYLVKTQCHLSQRDDELVIRAVLDHSKLNDPDDHPVTMVLKDADRLANIGPLVLLRAGQHSYQLPTCDPHFVEQVDPTATYLKPKTVLREVMFLQQYEPMLRLPKAIEIAKPWFEQLHLFIGGVKNQLKETDLFPFPF